MNITNEELIKNLQLNKDPYVQEILTHYKDFIDGKFICAECDKKDDTISELKTEIDDLTEELDQAKSENDDKDQEIQELKAELEKITEEG